MKSPLLCCLWLAAGFALSRFSPAGSGSARAPESRPTASAVAVVGPAEGGPMQNAPSSSGQARWETAATEWAEQDPQGFHDWLVRRGIPPGDHLLALLFKAWAAKDPDTAFTAVFNLPPDFPRQDYILSGMMQTVLARQEGLEMALKWMPAVDEQIYRIGWNDPAWASFGPPGKTGELLANQTTGTGLSIVMLQMFGKWWADQDPAAARNWLKSLPPGLRRSANDGVMGEWSRRDPAGVLEYLATDGDTAQRAQAGWPLQLLAANDPKAAMTWWENHLGVLNQTSMRWIYDSWCGRDGREAGHYALGIEDPSLRRNSLEAWARSADAGLVVETIRDIKTAADRNVLVESLGNLPTVPGEAAAFLRQLVESSGASLSAAAVRSVSRNFAAQDSAPTAFAWACTLPENLQSAAVAGVFQNWDDQASAAHAVEKLPDGPFKATAQKALEATVGTASK